MTNEEHAAVTWMGYQIAMYSERDAGTRSFLWTVGQTLAYFGEAA